MRPSIFLLRSASAASVESRKSASDFVTRLASKASQRSVPKQQQNAKSRFGMHAALTVSTVIVVSSVRAHYDRLEQWKEVIEKHDSMQCERDSALANIVNTRTKLEESVTEGLVVVLTAPRAERVQRLRDWITSQFEFPEDVEVVKGSQIAEGTGGTKDIENT